jgi:tetratricopeptide (TPR) repeat protein
MKKVFLLLVVFLSGINVYGQEDIKKMVRTAKRALQSYNLDQTNNKAKLEEAIKTIDEVVAKPEAAADFEAWYTRGQIYNEVNLGDALMKSINPAHTSKMPEAGYKALQSYMKAIDLAVKGYEKKDAAKGLNESMQGALVYGYDVYTAGDQATSHEIFKAILDAHDKLVTNKEKSPFSEEEDLNNQIYIVGVTALGSGNNVAASKYLNMLLDKGQHKPEIYDALYKLNIELKDEAAADKYLRTGREKFPDDVNLLFSEINNALRQGKLDELVSSLKTAIAKEPSNVSLYTTLGNVYDNLFQKTEDAEKKKMYFDSAFIYYTKALEINPESFDAVYSTGALYYNRAAEKTTLLQKMADDYSAPGIKKYKELQAEINEVFKQALPYFLKADTINNKDMNTLIALKEIYARLNDLDKSNTYKERLEALEKK